ncbi:FABP family protein [Egibacter rhizosphaerae]|uniref:FABP family protein n=1 Tax=Egibacter rhizosphaerae TaxID=1670831 RepID=A0A411YIR8_9ACTN|nr:FABP family protein [Egibacter rhizosphaerae]QBI21130.1 FABP family protein [Egibacter rhizosphaerae]
MVPPDPNTPPEPPAALAFLEGVWQGEGRGQYPTIDPFDYRERIEFTAMPKPFLRYEQETFDATSGAPLHVEVGYVRSPASGRVELMLAHPTGFAEVEEGELHVEDGVHRLRLVSRTVGATATAKRVDALERDVEVVGDRLDYRLRMAAVGEPMTHHLAATLHRVVDPAATRR